MESKYPTLESSELYSVAWISALAIERAAATALLDKIHNPPKVFEQDRTDPNSYTWGQVGEHNIVMASLGAGSYGTTSAATTVTHLIHSLPHIRIGLLVGIGGGISRPDNQDIRLGDIVVSEPHGTTGGVVQYDLGKAKANGTWEQVGSLNKPPAVLLYALERLKTDHIVEGTRIPTLLEAMWKKRSNMTRKKNDYTYQGVGNDRLFQSHHSHVGGKDCTQCDLSWEVQRDERDSTDPEIHYGVIASGNTLVKDAIFRDKLMEEAGTNILCVEMEAAGLMDQFPCLVIRGICDYADTHKNDRWQRYAAATAAAFAVELLGCVPAAKVQETPKVIDAVESR
jgi:nucleoside phosphorylase